MHPRFFQRTLLHPNIRNLLFPLQLLSSFHIMLTHARYHHDPKDLCSLLLQISDIHWYFPIFLCFLLIPHSRFLNLLKHILCIFHLRIHAPYHFHLPDITAILDKSVFAAIPIILSDNSLVYYTVV